MSSQYWLILHKSKSISFLRKESFWQLEKLSLFQDCFHWHRLISQNLRHLTLNRLIYRELGVSVSTSFFFYPFFIFFFSIVMFFLRGILSIPYFSKFDCDTGFYFS